MEHVAVVVVQVPPFVAVNVTPAKAAPPRVTGPATIIDTVIGLLVATWVQYLLNHNS